MGLIATRGVGLLALLVACSPAAQSPATDSPSTTDPPAAGDGDGPQGSAGQGADAPTPSAQAVDTPPSPGGPAPDEPPSNVSFETARALPLGADGSLLQQYVAGDQLDHFAFEAEAAGFYELFTNRGPFSPNTVITLYGPDRRTIAENDGGSRWPGDGVDARLVVRLTQIGTHYITVHDDTTPAAYFADPSAPVLFYRLTAHHLTDDSSAVFFDRDDGDDVAVAFLEDQVSTFRYVTLVGTFDGSADIFAFQGLDARALIGTAARYGTMGSGSTAEGGRLEVLDARAAVIASIDRAAGLLDIHPPVSDQPYRFHVQPGAGGGDNDFYAIDLVLLPDNPLERDDAANDLPDGAEPVELTGGRRKRGLLLSRLPPGDTDHYRFAASKGQRLIFSCEGQSAGSGLTGLHAEVFDPAGTPIATATETETEVLWIGGIELPSDGEYVVRLEAAGLRDQVAGDWARCVIATD